MNARPLVSVITPYYNAADYFKEALSCLERQTYPRFELIVVDDASPGVPAQEIVSAYSLPAVKVIRHQTNLGTQTARNTAVKNASGSLLVSFDCDDMLDPDYLTITVDALNDPDIAGVYTQIATFGEMHEIWTPAPSLLGVLTGSNSGPNTFLYRREVYDAVGGYRTGVYCSDASLWLSALNQGFRFKLVEKPLMRYRVRSDGRLAQFNKCDHISQLVAEFPDVYHEHLGDVLALQEERYWRLLREFRELQAGKLELASDLSAVQSECRRLAAECKRLEKLLVARDAHQGDQACRKT